MSQILLSVASLAFVGISAAIAYLKYREYANEIQRGIYQSIIGNEYEFEIEGRDETCRFEVVNIDVDTGHLPGRWRTIVILEFDIEEFPWDSQDEEAAADAAKDLRWTFNYLSPETPKINNVELFQSYKSPALLVSFPSTNLFYITDFLRKTQEAIGHVFWHYENGNSGNLSMRHHTELLGEYLEWITQNVGSDDN